MKKRSTREQRGESSGECEGTDRIRHSLPSSRKDDAHGAAEGGPFTAGEIYAAAREMLRRGKLEEAFTCELVARSLEEKARGDANEHGEAS